MEAKELAQLNGPVLVLGETGTGKTYLAKQIHKKSILRHQPFVQINVSSFSEDLFASELFGHVQGAFTGASANKKGFCEQVGEGYLFIDEVGELSMPNQVKLLTLIDERRYYPVGSTVEKSFKGKFLFATHQDLEKLVAEGRFRQDLYFRIRYFIKCLTPLKDDPDFGHKLLSLINDVKIKRDRMNFVLSSNCLQALQSYTWPGNFRELKNVIEFLFDLKKERIGWEDLPTWIKNSIEKSQVSFNIADTSDSYHAAVERFEKRYLTSALRKYHGKVNLTSQMVGISKVTLISKLKKYDIDRVKIKNECSLGKAYGF